MAQNCSLLSCPRPVGCFAHRLHQLSAAYHRLLHVDLLSSGQTEVCDLRHQVVSHQNVPGGQVSVDTLQREEGESNTSGHTRDDTVHMLLSLGLDLLGLGWTRLGL